MTPRRPVRRWMDLGGRRPVEVTVYSTGTVEFREKHRRKVYSAHMRRLLLVAVHNAIEDEKKERKAMRAARRAAL